MAIVRGQCGQCSMGCGLRVLTGTDRTFRTEGDPAHPANGGLLCHRAAALKTQADLEGRLLHPMVDGRGLGWDRAIATVARRLATVLARHGPGSVALHVGGALLTEDYYVANKLMKGFLGSAHIHAPWLGTAHVVQRTAFGEDVMPATLEDIDRADLILIAEMQAVETAPVLMDRIQAARAERGTRLVVLGSGRPAPNMDADLWLNVGPGGAARLLGGLLGHVATAEGGNGVLSAAHVAPSSRVAGPLEQGHDLWSVARACGLTAGAVRDLYDLWMATDSCVTLVGDGEVSLVAAAVNLHLATGRIGRPGSAPFIVTGAANGMGAREVGCTPDMLAAHRPFDAASLEQVTRFWGARSMAVAPGLEGESLLDAMRTGTIRALWSIGADEEALPWLDAARAAVPLSIRSTCFADEAAAGWTIALPSPVWIEKDGTVTGMDRLVSRHRRLFDLPGEARPDWWAVTKVAQAMGWADAFPHIWAADIYREHARLTAYGNDGMRILDLKRHAAISNPAYDELTPWRWGDVPFDEGRFATPDGRASLVPMDFRETVGEAGS
ncbi:assimilatory nitrate reductase catalytic subunit [Sphingobium sp. OAS761]|uniref:molybdopterin oxidoreductase family protein n=1 Tax=Sphingobium sp. OAS761 TaxID=2817901 RepID=UPI00209EE181|nr:molybdopterin-dependent oxidoreductase [Sphingobium sp. OAS761]MCP1468503.1 assimilatory nitrate reductase catalytic subunit [Sphingobium sp. OAS761]